MDDRSLFRFKPGYRPLPIDTALDWSEWGGFAAPPRCATTTAPAATRDAGVMCPSYRATGDEQHLTRGRANTLRLALSGQLGPEALVSDEMRETMALCISCKGCKRECPTGVDMARMKIEFLHHYRKRHGLAARDRADRLSAALCALRRAHRAAAQPAKPGSRAGRGLGNGCSASAPVANCRTGRRQPYRGAGPQSDPPPAGAGARGARDVVLLVDTFNRYFEPENARAAERVLTRAGYRVLDPDPPSGRPLCCGRTFLAAGLVDEARPRRGACSTRSRRMSQPARRSSGSSRPAC